MNQYFHPLFLIPILFLVVVVAFVLIVYFLGQPVRRLESYSNKDQVVTGERALPSVIEKLLDQIPSIELRRIIESANVATSEGLFLRLPFPDMLDKPIPSHLINRTKKLEVRLNTFDQSYDLPVWPKFPNLEEVILWDHGSFENEARWDISVYLSDLLEGGKLRSISIMSQNAFTSNPEGLQEFVNSPNLEEICIRNYRPSHLPSRDPKIIQKEIGPFFTKEDWKSFQMYLDITPEQLGAVLKMKDLQTLGIRTGDLDRFFEEAHYPNVTEFSLLLEMMEEHHQPDFLKLFPKLENLKIFPTDHSIKHLAHLKRSKRNILVEILDCPEQLWEDLTMYFSGSKITVISCA